MRTLSLVSVLVMAFAWTGCSDDDDNGKCNDNDGDGYGVGDKCLGPDCDDTDPAIHTSMDGYPDADGDGEYATTSVSLCTDGTLPSTHSATAGTDCDDDDADLYQNLEGYVDADGDGEGAATAMAETVCSGAALPAGYVEDNTDCDDGDDTVYETVNGYPDMDFDTVNAATAMDACTDGTLPDGWSATAGTDCDDNDAFATGDGSTMCNWKGTCVDTEMFSAAGPDARGIGACLSVDCDGSNPAVWDPTPTASSPTTCTADSDCASGDFCADDDPTDTDTSKACWTPPTDCAANAATGHTCSAIPDCLLDCRVTNPLPSDRRPTPAEFGAYAACVQGTCMENATPKAQFLYAAAQSCSANAGCFALPNDQVQSCALQNCLPEFGACLADIP